MKWEQQIDDEEDVVRSSGDRGLVGRRARDMQDVLAAANGPGIQGEQFGQLVKLIEDAQAGR